MQGTITETTVGDLPDTAPALPAGIAIVPAPEPGSDALTVAAVLGVCATAAMRRRA